MFSNLFYRGEKRPAQQSLARLGYKRTFLADRVAGMLGMQKRSAINGGVVNLTGAVDTLAGPVLFA